MKQVTHPTTPRWLITTTVLLGTVTVSINNTALNPAIPEFMSAFNAPASVASWVVSGYMISMGITMLATGYLSQKYGHKNIYLLGLALFVVGSSVGALSMSMTQIIIIRIIQGFAAGLMIPISLTLIFQAYPQNQRGRITGIWATAVMIAPAIGPAVGGILLEYYQWPVLFLMNIPFGVTALIIGLYCLQSHQCNEAAAFDWPGFISATIGVAVLMWALIQLSNGTSLSIQGNIFIFCLSALCFLIFIHIELSKSDPLLSIRIFTIPTYSLSVAISIILFISMFQNFIIFPILMRTVLGHSASSIGFALLINALFSSLCVNFSGRILDSRGPREIVALGLVLSAVSTYAFSFITQDSTLWTIYLLIAVKGIGFGMAYITVTTAGLNSIPERFITQGSAMNNIARRITASAAIILTTAYFDCRSSQLASHGATIVTSHLTAINETFLFTSLILAFTVPLALLLTKQQRITQIITVVTNTTLHKY